MTVFTRPAWLINSLLQGLFINCLCLFTMSILFLEAPISITLAFFPAHRLFFFVEDYMFVFRFSLRLRPGLPIHFVARSDLTDLEAPAGPAERTGEINLSLF